MTLGPAVRAEMMWILDIDTKLWIQQCEMELTRHWLHSTDHELIKHWRGLNNEPTQGDGQESYKQTRLISAHKKHSHKVMLSRMADTHRPTFTTNCNTSTQPWTERETFIFSPNRSLDLIDKFKEDTKLYCRQLLSASKEYEIWIHNVGKVQCTANNWLLDTQESDCLKNFQEKYIRGWRYWWYDDMRCGVVRDVRLWMMCRCPPWWRAGPCWAPAGRSQDSSCHSSWSVPASLTPGDSPHTTYIQENLQHILSWFNGSSQHKLKL